MRTRLIPICFLIIIISCKQDSTVPRPKAFVSIQFDDKQYYKPKFPKKYPFSFEVPKYSALEQIDNHLNLNFKKYRAKLHISYFSLENDLKRHTENSRRLAFKHTSKANSISEIIYQNDERNVYGVKFDFDGSTATSTQFFLTDSSNHFFRGALYFNTQKSDSLAIIEEYLKVDVTRIIETFCWK